jgi:hypothetical protein
MSSCEDQGFPCQSLDYVDFDKIAREELTKPIEARSLVSNSEFCMQIPVDDALIIGDLDHRLFLKTLRGKSGLYQLWVDYQSCDDHDTSTMLCVYVGKGPPEKRVTSHIKEKWHKDVQLFATFSSMSNRLAKYYEQLFLDCYHFDLNFAENAGTEKLYAVWDHERFIIGTHSNEVAGLSKMQGFEDW